MFNFKSETVVKHQPLAAKIIENLKTEVVGGQLKIEEATPRKAYEESLPEGLTMDHVSQISKHNRRYITAANVAVGQVFAGAMIQDRKIKSCDATIGFNAEGDTIAINGDQSKTYKNTLGQGPAEVTKWLQLRTTVDIGSAIGSGLKPVRTAMSEEFAGVFNK